MNQAHNQRMIALTSREVAVIEDAYGMPFEAILMLPNPLDPLHLVNAPREKPVKEPK